MTTPTERLEAESWAKRAERELRARVEAQEVELKELRALAAFYDAGRKAPIKIPKWQVRPAKGGNHGLVVAQVADWHLGEVVKPDEVLGLNQFNRSVAHSRVKTWAEKVVTLPRDYINGVAIDGLIVPATGDLFTGEIHQELRETNDAPILADALHWMEPVIGMLRMFEGEYPAVAVHAVVGNHGRLDQKPIFKGRVERNIEWFFWSIVRDRLADLGSSVVVNVSPSMDLNVPIYGRNHLVTHGDTMKGGTGIAGAFSPLSLGAHRKGRRQSIAGLPMETMVLGHMHQLINIPGVKMGGTLKGYDEYAFGLNLPPDPNGAGQAMWVTSPERAEVLWMPIYVQDNAAELELS